MCNCLLMVYIPCSKKGSHLMFYNKMKSVDRFSKFFTRWFVRKFSMYTSQRFPPHLHCVATLPCESRRSKNVTKFSRWTWQLICLICLTKIYNVRSYVTCHRKYRTNIFDRICICMYVCYHYVVNKDEYNTGLWQTDGQTDIIIRAMHGTAR